MASANPTVYQRVVEITHIYLGPAADRFIDRQVQNHIHKDANKLTVDDLEKLVDWIRVAVSLLTDDSEIVEEYITQLQRIVKSSEKGQSGRGRKTTRD